MKGFKALSAVRRDAWFIDPGYVHSQMDLLGLFLQNKFQSTNDDSPRVNSGGGAGIIMITGPLFKYDGFCGEPGYQTYAQLLQELENDTEIDKIIFSIDTPGGQGSGLREFASIIKNCSKPTIAWVNDSCCSAGYWLASQCDFIYCSQTTDTVGSIGAFCILTNYLKAAEADGKPLIEVYSSLSTEKNLSVREALKGNTELLQAELDELVNVFISDVKAGRGDRLNLEAGDPFKGACFNADKALTIGLIDGIQSLAAVINSTHKKSNKSNMKFTKLTSLASKAANSVTPEFLEEVNAELTEVGITEFTVAPQSIINEAAQATTDLAEAQTTIEGHVQAITEKDATITALKEALTEAANAQTALQSRVDELESLIPGKKTTAVSKGDSTVENNTSPKSWEQNAARKFSTN